MKYFHFVKKNYVCLKSSRQKLVVTFCDELWQKLAPIGGTNCDGNDPELGVAFIYRCRPKWQKDMGGNYCNYDNISNTGSKFLINFVIIVMISTILWPTWSPCSTMWQSSLLSKYSYPLSVARAIHFLF